MTQASCSAVIALVAVLATGCGGGLTAQEQAELNALTDCQMAIKRASRNASTVEAPYVPNTGSATQFRFAWAQGEGLQMQNGFGAIEDVAALCVHEDGRIKLLTIGPQVVIQP